MIGIQSSRGAKGVAQYFKRSVRRKLFFDEKNDQGHADGRKAGTLTLRSNAIQESLTGLMKNTLKRKIRRLNAQNYN